MTTQLDFHCAQCGSRNVIRDAFAQWNLSAQVWEMSGTNDYLYCGDCDSTDIKQVEIETQETPYIGHVYCLKCKKHHWINANCETETHENQP